MAYRRQRQMCIRDSIYTDKIVHLPIEQRYGKDDMQYIIDIIEGLL